MNPWNAALREGAVSGNLAGLLSAAALALAGRREVADPNAPANATSHWLWGDEALSRRGPDLRHTATGFIIHQLASCFWATLHARAIAGRPASIRPGPALVAAGATAVAAALVDLKIAPHRLSPGFEHRLSGPALVAVYGCFALGLAMGSLAVGRARGSRTPRRESGSPARSERGTVSASAHRPSGPPVRARSQPPRPGC
jgi:hypothetical protein